MAHPRRRPYHLFFAATTVVAVAVAVVHPLHWGLEDAALPSSRPPDADGTGGHLAATAAPCYWCGRHVRHPHLAIDHLQRDRVMDARNSGRHVG